MNELGVIIILLSIKRHSALFFAYKYFCGVLESCDGRLAELILI